MHPRALALIRSHRHKFPAALPPMRFGQGKTARAMVNGLCHCADYIRGELTGSARGLEIGSYAGESLLIWARSGMRVIDCVDLWKPGKYGAARMNLARETFSQIATGVQRHGRCRVRQHQGRSTDVLEKIRTELLDPQNSEHDPVRWIYIDGDHSAAGVAADIYISLRLLIDTSAPTPILAGHDYGHPKFPGVARTVDHILGPPDRTFADGSWATQLTPARIRHARAHGLPSS